MSLARRAARAALAASFISGGLDQLRNPQSKAGPASPIAKPIAERVPQLPDDPESLVRLDGAIKVLGGTALVFGPFARPAALLLAGSLVPTTLAGHRFWETTDPDQRVSDRVEFFKNVSLIGGLLIAALDTGGRPSIPWVAGQGAAETVGEAAETVGHAVQGVTGTVAGAAGTVAHGAGRGRRLGRRRAARRADKAARVADALKVAAAAKAVKAARKAEKTRSGKRSDRVAKARAAKAGAAAVTAGAAAKGAAASARTAAKETALAAKEKVGAVVSR